jgi:para-nitrobenzyl esterase
MDGLVLSKFCRWVLLPALLLPAGCGPRLSPNVALTRGLVYGYGYTAPDGGDYLLEPLYFDLLTPDDRPEAGKPALLMVHGGSFEGGSRSDEELVMLADSIATKGVVCFLIDYRLARDNPPAPAWLEKFTLPSPDAMHAAFVDTRAAVRYIRANAAEFGIDPDRIAIFGESAGAIAALAAGLTGDGRFDSDGPGFPVPAENHPDTPADVTCIIDCWGTADFFLDAFDTGDPPIMVFHGVNDFTAGVSLAPAINIRNKCEEYGIPCRYYPLWDEDHGAWEAEYNGKSLSLLCRNFLDTFNQ